MSEEQEIPEGAAVFPEIPEELGIHPLLLAVLHSTVFLSGSTEDVVHTDAADEALDYMVHYLERLDGEDLNRVREDMECLIRYGRQEKWPRQLTEALKSFQALYEPEDET